MTLNLHPLCAAFPPMSDTELAALADDMRQRGFDRDQPIVRMPDGSILDGRNRELAAVIAGIGPHYVTYDGDDPQGFVCARNLLRRHLDTTQRAFIAAELANLKQGDNRFTVDLSNERSITMSKAAEDMKVGLSSVQDATAINKNGTPELKAKALDNVVSFRDAATVARRIPKSEQNKLTPTDIKGMSTRKSARQTMPPKPKREKIHIPYQKMQWPTAEEVGRPHDDPKARDEHIDRYGRTPLHPMAVADLLKSEGAAITYLGALRSFTNQYPDGPEQFLDDLGRLLTHVPQKEKNNGLERNFAGEGQRILRQLRELLPTAVTRLTKLQAALAAYDNQIAAAG